MIQTDAYIKLVLAQIRKGGFFFKSNGKSMYPNILCGDELEVEEVKSILPGDVILYYTIQHEHVILIAHRLQNIQDSYCICKGDNNFCFDPPVKTTQILGKVIVPNIQENVKEFEARTILKEWISDWS